MVKGCSTWQPHWTSNLADWDSYFMVVKSTPWCHMKVSLLSHCWVLPIEFRDNVIVSCSHIYIFQVKMVTFPSHCWPLTNHSWKLLWWARQPKTHSPCSPSGTLGLLELHTCKGDCPAMVPVTFLPTIPISLTCACIGLMASCNLRWIRGKCKSWKTLTKC